MSVDRRTMLAGLAAAAAGSMSGDTSGSGRSYLELKVWRLHNSGEDQSRRVGEFLQNGLAPMLARTGSKLIGAFANTIGNDGPFYMSLAQFASFEVLERSWNAAADDHEYAAAVDRLSEGSGAPFVRVESSLLRSFAVFPQAAVEAAAAPRTFELRTYESPSFGAGRRKVGMFNAGEAKIFERLGMKPVFFGETLVGPKQPNLMYMLSYASMAEHDRLWGEFGKDSEWAKLRAQPGLSDAEIVANISNVILHPLEFSPIR